MIPEEIKAEERALMVIYKDLTVLQAENRVHLKGQPIIAKNGLGKLGLKIGDWDFEADDISAGTPFNDLDWLVAPEAAGSGGYTPFKIRTTSPQYQMIGSTLVITDTRLILAEDPSVFVGKWADFLDDSDMVVDPLAGTITIADFGGMPADQHIEIFVPSLIRTADSIDSILPRIEKLELYTKPYAMGGAIYVWRKPAIAIPAEFQEVVDLRGKTIVGQLTTDADFANVWTSTGGSKTHTLTIAQLPVVQPKTKPPYNNQGGGAVGVVGAATYNDKITGTASDSDIIEPFGGGQAHPIMNPYRIVMFIELKEEFQTI